MPSKKKPSRSAQVFPELAHRQRLMRFDVGFWTAPRVRELSHPTPLLCEALVHIRGRLAKEARAEVLAAFDAEFPEIALGVDIILEERPDTIWAARRLAGVDASARARQRRSDISPRARFAVLQRDDFRCRYRGAKAQDATLHIDHIIPLAKGGTNSPENLAAACEQCNLGKGAALLQRAPRKGDR